LQPNAQQVLQIIGKHTAADPSIQGILLPERIPHALEALSHSITQEEAQRQQALLKAKADNLPAPRFEAISLRQRALPLMTMMRTCHQATEAITWGV